MAVPVAMYAVLLGLTWIATLPDQGSAPPPGPEDSVTMLTVNAQLFLSSEGGIRSNLRALESMIREQEADVVALQESDANNVLGGNQNGVLMLAQRLGYQYAYGAPSREYTSGTALLSRWPLDDIQWRVLPARASMPRAGLSATVLRPGGHFKVVAGHLQWAEEYLPGEPTAEYVRDQVEQANVLLDMAAGSVPVAIMGDFNAGPGYPGPAYEMFAERFEDAWSAAGFDPYDPAGYTWPASEPTMRIDFVWYSPAHWQVVPGAVAVVGDETVSDHRAVVARLLLNGG